MSLPIPLAVRLRTARADRYVTADLRDLTYRSTIPGGFASATLSFHRPLIIQPSEVDYFADAIVYDKRTGEVAWEGSLEDPSRAVSSDGQVWGLKCIGAAGHARDINRAAVWIDRDLTGLVRTVDTNNMSGAEDSIIGATAQLLLPVGLPVVTGSTVTLFYDRMINSGQSVEAFGYGWTGGITDASLLVEGLSSSDGIVDTLNRSDAINVAGGAFVLQTAVANRNSVKLRLRWTGGATSVTAAEARAAFSSFVVVAGRRTKAGVNLTAGGSYASTVLASEVVEDLLGWLLTRYDGANAVVQATTYGIQQLAYPDGIDPAGVLGDLMRLEPDFYWAAWERNPANKKYRFEWRAWPTTIRYEASTADGFDSPGSSEGLYSAVTARYLNQAGQTRVRYWTQTVPALVAAGVSREALIDLGDEIGGVAASADQVAQQWLAQHQTPPNRGRLTVARPIYDAERGRMVQPWEIRPGGLIRVRGVQPRTDGLNPAGRDGSTIFRVVGVEFTASSASAVLELDSTPLSVASLLAELQRGQGRRRR